ncbi:MAG: TetR/AcrR family transcriptional regulator [Firmicutes bacterium]|nr:TetR/AcrR family transcriptional regulator [Bacillota bacterium]
MRTDVRKTQNSICLALLSLIKEMPYDKITVRDIVTRAEVSRSSFYNHFNEKDDVMKMIIEKLCDRISGKEDFVVKEKYDRSDLVASRFKVIDYCYSRHDEILNIYRAGFGPEFGKAERRKLYDVHSMFDYEYVDEYGNVEVLSEGIIYDIKVWESVSTVVAVIELMFNKYSNLSSEEYDKMVEQARQLKMTGKFYVKRSD